MSSAHAEDDEYIDYLREPEPYKMFLEDVQAGLWDDTTFQYNEWLIANGYLT